MSCGGDEMAVRSSSAVTLVGSGIVSRIARSGDIGLNRGSDTVKASITSHMAVHGVESNNEMSRQSRRPWPGSNLRTHGRGRAQGHPPLRATTISGQATLPSSEERCASPLRSQHYGHNPRCVSFRTPMCGRYLIPSSRNPHDGQGGPHRGGSDSEWPLSGSGAVVNRTPFPPYRRLES